MSEALRGLVRETAFTVFFAATPVTDYESARCCDTERYSRYFHRMLDRGVYLAPSQFEACFVSMAHSRRDVRETLKAAGEAFRAAGGDRSRRG